jgi:hypothetical protein
MLARGLWLYVWRVQAPQGEYLYVGRTGDSSSRFATPPYQRMGQHLGHQRNSNALRQHLRKAGVVPEECLSYHLVCHGPLFDEAADMETHRPRRDCVAAMEKALADELAAAGYNVMNAVRCRKPLDAEWFDRVRTAFGGAFPRLLERG